MSQEAPAIKEESGEILVHLYFWPAGVYWAWFQYQHAMSDSFAYWITIENVISAVKCLFWPLLLTYHTYCLITG